MRQVGVLEQRPLLVGDDELVRILVVANRECVAFVVLDQADDLELQLGSVDRFDDDDVSEL